MEGGSGVDATPTADHADKTRVLDVKPLRSLLPVFPDGKQGPPFVCAPPFGPFPSGLSPFYPFSPTRGVYQTPPDLNQAQPIPFATPLNSYRASAEPNGDASHQKPNSSRRKVRKALNRDVSSSGSRGRVQSNANFDSGISLPEKDNGNRELVASVLMRFDALRRKVSQLEDSREAAALIRRSDLKAGAIMMSKGVRTNTKKRVGVVPGVEVGDIFFFRMEMCVVGLHSPSMAGIDYMILRGDGEDEPVATSIVSSGYYDNDAEDPDTLIYSGQGGNADKDKQASDQKLERGNLALEKSLRRDSVVRVIRGLRDVIGQNTKIYVYDGLYSVKGSWVERGKSGCNTFKYKLIRVPSQPPAFAVWKSIQKWKAGLSPRTGLILSDLTSGAESIPVAVVNDVDSERGPGFFTYSPTLKYVDPIKVTQPSFGCSCSSACQPGNLNCSCIRKNGGDFPYTGNGILVCRKPLMYECGSTCQCSWNCKNRVSQTGLKVRLEVFKTLNRGWGLRSWDPIRSGSFICEYAGELRDKTKLNDDDEDDDYIFDTSRLYNTFKWNCEPELMEEDTFEGTPEEFDIPSPFVITAKNVGNVSRFMNHSCFPNVFWQPVVHERDDESHIHIAFFAMRHIPPMTELTYDYGVSQTNGTQDGRGLYGKKKCVCGYDKCRGSFG